MARKQIVIPKIDADPRFERLAAVLRVLVAGLARIEAEADALRIEGFLERKPSDSRAAVLKERLKKHRGSAAPKAEPPPASDVPAVVAAALEIIRSDIRPPRRVDRATLIAQLEDDHHAVRAAICEQQAALDALRGELSAELAGRLQAQHRDIVLQQFRAAQALAAATDADHALRRAVTEAGFLWRSDLLPAPTANRATLVLGSESEFDSEISRTRRALEELKIL